MTARGETIFALSSGGLPAAIAIIRISGPDARLVAGIFDFAMPAPRRASVRVLRCEDGDIDTGLVLYFPGPASATGDDMVELHVHGSRAVVRAVIQQLSHHGAMRAADAGEFTRRALFNGRLGLIETEALGDLLSAETETQRRRAVAAPSILAASVERLRGQILELSAQVEAAIDHDMDGVADIADRTSEIVRAVAASLSRPSAARLREGFRVVIAGPPNAGKSTLLNALVGRDAAITSDIAGTTRDVIDVGITLGAFPVRFVDTAGLRTTDDSIEQIGVARALAEITTADVLIWLGDGDAPVAPADVISIWPKADLTANRATPIARLHVSAVSGEGIDALRDRIQACVASRLPPETEALWNDRQREILQAIAERLNASIQRNDLVLAAEELRAARNLIDRLTGRAGLEDLLDSVFANFCLGK